MSSAFSTHTASAAHVAYVRLCTSTCLSTQTVTSQPCRLLATPPPIRALILDYLHDRTAILCLTSCRSLYAGYHQYPVKQAVSVYAVTRISALDVYSRYDHNTWRFAYVGIALAVASGMLRYVIEDGTVSMVMCVLGLASAAVGAYLLVRFWLIRRVHCCSAGWGWRIGVFTGEYRVPRVQRLHGELKDVRLLRYLQHLTELHLTAGTSTQLEGKYVLPRSLRMLRLTLMPCVNLTPNTLPPRLTSLSLTGLNSKPLLAGVLPDSLTSLHLAEEFDTSVCIEAGVLPAGLLTLKMDAWTQSLSHIALPASLTELDIRLSDCPLPATLPQLQVLRIGGAFNQPLTGVLPSSLRILRLDGHFDQPLSADVFASTPALEELYLSDVDPGHCLKADELPRSLRLLRLGQMTGLRFRHESEVPQLRRLELSARVGPAVLRWFA